MFSAGTGFEGAGGSMSLSAGEGLIGGYINISASTSLGNYDGGTISLHSGSGHYCNSGSIKLESAPTTRQDSSGKQSGQHVPE